jgi:chemosensory pili system protein ChpA (sensor histidine kinase/response regulator)
VQRFTPEALGVIQSIRELSWMGDGYQFSYLLELFGQRDARPEGKRFSHVLLLRSGGQRLAVQVDELIGIRQVVVKSTGPQLATVSGIVGATVLADGEIVLIVNPVTLGQRLAVQSADIVVPQRRQTSAPAVRSVPIVMVVDDSITVRKISERTLSREGYQVILAKDGLDALEKLRDITPDAMLVDIEMPRMDGFDLTRSVRADSKTQHVPIIMITSRTAEKHRNYALQLGVNVYLGKPYTDEDLTRHIRALIGQRQAETARAPGELRVAGA